MVICQNITMKNKTLIYRDVLAANRILKSGIFCVALSLMALTGCVATPHTTIEGAIGGKPFLVKAPKDGDLTGFDLTAETNGSVHVHIDRLTVKMNPDVISQTGVAQTAIIKATGDAITSAAAATAAGVAQGLK
jgi:hypothetical protein